MTKTLNKKKESLEKKEELEKAEKRLLEDFSANNELSDLDRSWQSSNHNTEEPLALPLENMAYVSCVSDLNLVITY